MSEQHETQSFDRLLDALKDVQRRRVLVALEARTSDPDGSIDITATEVNIDESSQRIELYHVHLPKLADYGLVEWDEKTDRVAPGPTFDEIRPLVGLLADHEDELPPDCF